MKHTISVTVLNRETDERILEIFQWCIDQFGLPAISRKTPHYFRRFNLTHKGDWWCDTALILDGHRLHFTFDRNAAILFKLKWGEYCDGH